MAMLSCINKMLSSLEFVDPTKANLFLPKSPLAPVPQVPYC